MKYTVRPTTKYSGLAFIYEIDNGELILYLTRTGSHSDLF